MSLHPQAQAIIDAYNSQAAQLRVQRAEQKAKGVQSPKSLLQMRREASNNAARMPDPEGADGIRALYIPGPAGEIPIRVLRPCGEDAPPILLYFHGGGWVLGTIEQDAIPRQLVKQAGCAAVLVGYRLAPEAKFPAALEDCFAAAQWVRRNAETLRIDGLRVAVGGDSSGGNLAAALCLLARDRGEPPLSFQLLLCPVIEPNFVTESYVAYADGYLLTRKDMINNWKLYLSRDSDSENPYAAPIRDADPRGLPPALVITAECDPLRDEGEAYAKHLKEAGVPTECKRYEGMFHGFLSYSDGLDAARDGIRLASERLMSAFARGAGDLPPECPPSLSVA